MNARELVANALLRLYPRSWRNEYGGELTEILLLRPLTARAVCDVAWNGSKERARASRPSTILGLASMLVIVAGFILTPTQYGHQGTALLRPSSMTFPTVTVTFLTSEVYVLLLLICGGWTRQRYGGTAHQSGLAAMRMTLIASIPIIFGALLIAAGIVDMTFLEPGLPGTTVAGVASPAAAVQAFRPHPLAMMVAPIARLPESWIWGAIGGWLGRRLCRARPTATVS
jgi:hypothetical protein